MKFNIIINDKAADSLMTLKKIHFTKKKNDIF